MAGAETDPIIVPVSGALNAWQAVAEIAPTGSPDVFDVLRNGVSIFAGGSPPNYPSIPAGSLAVQSGSAFGSVVAPISFTDLYVVGFGYQLGSLSYSFTSIDIGQRLTITGPVTSPATWIPGVYMIAALVLGPGGIPNGEVFVANLSGVLTQCAVASSTGGTGSESGSAATVTLTYGDVLIGVMLSTGSPAGQGEKLQLYAQ